MLFYDENELEKLLALHRELGITMFQAYEAHHFYPEARQDQLVLSGQDCFGRDYYLTREASQAWYSMVEAAAAEGVSLQAVSAFRGVQYQADIIRKKLEKGLTIEDILKVNAAPGMSEHHTGCAIDMTSPEEAHVLTESFEKTKAFQWLSRNAKTYGFTLSFPRGNPLGMDYEPWHWCFKNL